MTDKKNQTYNSPVIEFSSVGFEYSEQSNVFMELNFKVLPGENLFIHGPSGCGKTTLLNLCGGILLPQKGGIQVMGTETSSLNSRKRDLFRCDHIGYLFQIFNLIPYLSVLDNVLLPLHFSKLRRSRIQGPPFDVAMELLENLGLKSISNQKAQKLSIGQQQRVAAARAIIGSPDIILADEPTSALDSNSSDQLLELLLNQKTKKYFSSISQP